MILCPYCQSENIVWLTSQDKYKCNDCGAHFTFDTEQEKNGKN